MAAVSPRRRCCRVACIGTYERKRERERERERERDGGRAYNTTKRGSKPTGSMEPESLLPSSMRRTRHGRFAHSMLSIRPIMLFCGSSCHNHHRETSVYQFLARSVGGGVVDDDDMENTASLRYQILYEATLGAAVVVVDACDAEPVAHTRRGIGGSGRPALAVLPARTSGGAIELLERENLECCIRGAHERRLLERRGTSLSRGVQLLETRCHRRR